MDPMSRLRQESYQGIQPIGFSGDSGSSSNSGLQGSQSNVGWGEGMFRSALWAMGPGLVGVRPAPSLEQWQAENPIKSFASGVAGLAVPYAGWAKATQGAGALGRGVQGWMDKAAPLSAMATNPIRTAATREVVRFAPFEAGRIAAAPVLGPMFESATDGTYMGVGDVAASATTDLVLGGAIGGLFGAISSYGRKLQKSRGSRPGADLNAPLQTQWRQIDEAVAKGQVPEEKLHVVRGAKNRIAREIFKEAPKDGKYFEKDYLQNAYGQLFETKAKTRFRVKPIGDKGLFRSNAIADTLAKLPEGWQSKIRFPRIVQTRLTGDMGKNQKNFQATQDLLGRLGNGGGGTRWEYLADEKTFIVSRQLTDTDHLVFKTDSPDFWMPENAAWKDMLEDGSRATFGPVAAQADEFGPTGSELLDYGRQLKKDLPHVDWRGIEGQGREGLVASTAKELLAKSGFKPYEGTSEGLRRAGLFVRRYMAPAQLQTTDNPLANMIRVGQKEIIERGEQLTQRSILGTPKRQAGSQHKSAFFGPKWEDNGSIAAQAKTLSKSPDEWDAVIKTIQSGDGWQQGISRHGLSERGAQLLRALDAEDARLTKSIQAVQRAAGIDDPKIFVPRKNHYMLSRTWQGDWRVPVYNGRGDLVYIAGGNTRSHANAIAQEVVDKTPGLRKAEAITSSETADIELLRRVIDQDVDFTRAMKSQQEIFRASRKEGAQPGTMQQRKGVEGYKQDYDADDFIRAMINHGRRYRRYEAETSGQILYKKDLNRLREDDPEAFTTLMARLDKMYGKEGNITKAINDAFDTVLSPVLGNNSASKITGAVNKLIYRFALGFFNQGYALATMATFIQTTFPMMQMVNSLAHQAPGRLAKYTSYQPIMSADGGMRMMGNIDTLKVAGQGWKELGNPDETLLKALHRAAEEGVTDPRFIDEWVGQSAINKQKFLGVLEEREAYVKFMQMAADSMPAMTERYSRGHTFSMGHVFYRDIMGVKDPEILFRLAKEFTEKTQYMYSAGDRAQIFNGPIGGMFGLFKNWMSHYMGWMLAYAGEGVRYGNWKPLLWQMGGTASVGGLGALPFIGLVDDLTKFFNNEGLLMNMYEMQGGADPEGLNLADAMYYGLPGLLGVSIQGTVSAPLAEPGDDIIRMFSLAQWNQGKKIAQMVPAVGRAIDQHGLHGFTRDQDAVRAIINATMPKTLLRTAQMMEGPDLRSMTTGNPMIKGLSPVQRVLYAASLNPTEVEAQFEISRDLWSQKDKLRADIGYWGQQMANAQANMDWQEVNRIYMLAMARGLPMDSIVRSAGARTSRAGEGLIDSQFDAQVQLRMRELGIL